MPSESIAGFLDHAQASRVLFPEQIEQLIRQPDVPQRDLDELCDYLLSRGVLTRFQAAAIREQRGRDLTFAGYPILDEIGPCPGGTAYKALHPSFRTPLVLRRIRPDWLAPADGPTGFIARARKLVTLEHPNVVHLLDAGVYHDEVYAVLVQPTDAADLETLATEIGGAMPAFLAAEFCRPVAAALRAIHELGATHGDVRPANLLVAPLAAKSTPDGQTRRRPAPDAVVRLAELGLVPVRPAVSTHPDALTAYLPPERLVAGTYDPRGDVYSLGATLYFLLTGRAPFAGASTRELMDNMLATEPPPLAALRPDLPPEFVALVTRMMERRLDLRPETAAEVEAALASFCRPGTVPPTPEEIPTAVPASSAQGEYRVVSVEPVAGHHADGGDQPWVIDDAALAGVHAGAEQAPRKRQVSAADRRRTRLLLVLGGLLHLCAVGLLVAWLVGAFDPPAEPADDPGDRPAPKRGAEPPERKTRSGAANG